jgi:hypothetical protein
VSATRLVRLARSPRGFLMLALIVALVCWSLGLLITPDRKRFLTSPEWHYQPFYLAAHIVALQLFALTYQANYNAGIAHLESAPGQQAVELIKVLTPLTGVLALMIAAPFCILDYLFLYSDRSQKMGDDGVVRTIDLLMWGIWCAEWYLNALIWIVLIGYSVKSCWVIRHYRFKSPIEVVLHERQYRPFLRMSAQGASILFGFSCATVFYIWYTGGELTDYAGLIITGVLLIIGFVSPWLLLRSKVDRAVRQEMLELRRQLALDMQRGRDATAGNAVRTIDHRLDEVLGMLRITFLEQRHDKIGQTEAKAVLVRLMAPAATVAWQFRQHSIEVFNGLGLMLNDLGSYFARLGGA